MVPPKAIPRMGVTSGEGGQSGEQGTSRASAEPIELGAIKNREKVLGERMGYCRYLLIHFDADRLSSGKAERPEFLPCLMFSDATIWRYGS
jgi:hypothetical protein